MPKKFSLKDNPIFQRSVVPEPSPPVLEEPSQHVAEGEKKAGPAEHRIERRSNFDPQNLRVKNRGSDFDLQENIDKSLFFEYYNEVSDTLLPNLSPAEQVIYTRLFRLSYGWNKNFCTVNQPALQSKCGLSKNSIRTGIQKLIEKGVVAIVDSGNHVPTTYRVYLPREIRGSNSDPQNLRVKNRGSKFEQEEGQNLRVKNSTSKETPTKNSLNNNGLHKRGSNSDPQDLTPLLFTNNNITLSHEKLVEYFYSSLNQSPSAKKRERGIKEIQKLLGEGFTLEQIAYAADWTVRNYPDTASFDRIPHLIDQALKHKTKEDTRKQAEEEKTRRELEEQKRAKEQRVFEEKVKTIRASLSPQELKGLRARAEAELEREGADKGLGYNVLVKIKEDELIQREHLKAGGEL